MKLWIDDVRPAPQGKDWVHLTSVDVILWAIVYWESINVEIELIDIDHDAGDCAKFGGDYIRVLDWLEATGRNYPIRIHSQNSVGVQNMRRIIQKNGWKEVF